MLNIAICNGEKEEAVTIRRIVEGYMDSHTIIYKIQFFDSGEALIEANTQFDFVLLDILMKDANGIEVGMKLYQRNSKLKIIYITRFNEYWKEAINQAHAFAYLSIPIDEFDLTNQISDLIKELGINRRKDVEIEVKNVKEIGTEKEYLSMMVSISNILYYEYIKDTRRIKIKTQDSIYEYTGTMADVEKKMQIYGFTACYRGILVNFEHVTRAKGNTVYLNNGEMLPLSQKRAVKFKNQLKDYNSKMLC